VKITISNIIGNEKLSGLLMNFLYFNLTVEFIGLFFGKLLKTRKIFTKICFQKRKSCKTFKFPQKNRENSNKKFPTDNDRFLSLLFPENGIKYKFS
jgi:hypothetical protein